MRILFFRFNKKLLVMMLMAFIGVSVTTIVLAVDQLILPKKGWHYSTELFYPDTNWRGTDTLTCVADPAAYGKYIAYKFTKKTYNEENYDNSFPESTGTLENPIKIQITRRLPGIPMQLKLAFEFKNNYDRAPVIVRCSGELKKYFKSES